MLNKNTNSSEALPWIMVENYLSALLFINRIFLVITLIALFFIMLLGSSLLSSFVAHELKTAFIVVGGGNIVCLLTCRANNTVRLMPNKLLAYMMTTAGIGYITYFSQALKYST